MAVEQDKVFRNTYKYIKSEKSDVMLKLNLKDIYVSKDEKDKEKLKKILINYIKKQIV